MVNKYKNKVIIELSNDVKHYKNINIYKHIDDINKQYSWNTIYAFGGGFPKLESFLKYKKVLSFDMMAEMYREFEKYFFDLYKPSNDIKLIQQEFEPDDLTKFSFEEKDLITFVHFLEHFDQKDILLILEYIPKNIHVLIYGPNASVVNNHKKNQFSFLPDEHKTLFSLDFLENYLKNNFSVHIEKKFAYSDDLFILFKKT